MDPQKNARLEGVNELKRGRICAFKMSMQIQITKYMKTVSKLNLEN